jgi:biphenyl 2,3-dioxygenase ferredoxin subunit
MSNKGFFMTQTCTQLDLCATKDVNDGQALKVEKPGLTLAVFNLEGDFFVTDDLCTHGPGSLSEGCIIGDAVECNFHNGVFDIRTGEVLAPPCLTPLKTYPVSIEGGRVFISLL